MLHRISYILFALFIQATTTYAQLKENGYQISGTFKGIKNGHVKMVEEPFGKKTPHILGSTSLKDGKFTLNGKIASPKMVTLYIEPGNYFTSFFLDNSKITISADTAGATHSIYGSKESVRIKNSKIEGSPSNDAIHNCNKFSAKMDREGLIKYLDELAAKESTAFAAAYLVDIYGSLLTFTTGEFEHLLKRLTPYADNSGYYKSINERIKKKKGIEAGKIAPDFTLLKRDSTKLTLSSLRGKYVLIDFWASWCVPCRKAIPHWKTVYAKYKDVGFEILSTSIDDKWALWTKALDAEKMPWQQVFDQKNATDKTALIFNDYPLNYIPFYVLLDKEGRILVSTGDEKEIDSKLLEIFKN